MHAVLVSVYILLVTPITLSSWAASAVNQQLHPKHLVMDPNQVCMKYHRSGKPPSMCHKPKLLRQISYGVALGLNECQYQFRFRRWNCTAEKRSMKKVMLRDTRETGFVNAIIAAGVTYQVTRACTKGDLIGCTCHKKIRQRKKQKSFVGIPKGRWAWDICGGDNIDYGIRRSKDFLDWRHKNKNHTDVKNLVKLHNFVAGRLAIKNRLRPEYKCHGLSGSCTLRTLALRMPNFREIGDELKARFDGASKVIAENDGKSFIPEGETIKTPEDTDLVYSEDSSPTAFCQPNRLQGSFGTKDRICNETSPGEDGCVIMCCGRGHTTLTIALRENCRCKFNWCCDVSCETCLVNATTHVCN